MKTVNGSRNWQTVSYVHEQLCHRLLPGTANRNHRRAEEVLKELKAIGNNLNQLVTLAHMGKVTVINLSEVRQLLAGISITIREIAERRRW